MFGERPTDVCGVWLEWFLFLRKNMSRSLKKRLLSITMRSTRQMPMMNLNYCLKKDCLFPTVHGPKTALSSQPSGVAASTWAVRNGNCYWGTSRSRCWAWASWGCGAPCWLQRNRLLHEVSLDFVNCRLNSVYCSRYFIEIRKSLLYNQLQKKTMFDCMYFFFKCMNRRSQCFSQEISV